MHGGRVCKLVPRYDCNHQPEHMWSDTKVPFDCRRFDLVTFTPWLPNVTPQPLTSDSCRAWCCKHYPPQGCPTTTEPGIAHVARTQSFWEGENMKKMYMHGNICQYNSIYTDYILICRSPLQICKHFGTYSCSCRRFYTFV